MRRLSISTMTKDFSVRMEMKEAMDAWMIPKGGNILKWRKVPLGGYEREFLRPYNEELYSKLGRRFEWSHEVSLCQC